MTRLSLLVLTLAFLFGAGRAEAMCYTVHDAQDRVLFQSARAPVSLAGSLSEAVEARFPGARMTISDTLPCREFDLTTAAGRAAAAAQRVLASTQMMDWYAPSAPRPEIEASGAAGALSSVRADPPAAPKATWQTERIVEAREVPVYVPVYLPAPHAYQRHVPSAPVAPSDNGCRTYGFFSHCADGTRAMQQGHFRFPADGSLNLAPAMPASPPRPSGGPR
jgi:hypothetical protein